MTPSGPAPAFNSLGSPCLLPSKLYTFSSLNHSHASCNSSQNNFMSTLYVQGIEKSRWHRVCTAQIHWAPELPSLWDVLNLKGRTQFLGTARERGRREVKGLVQVHSWTRIWLPTSGLKSWNLDCFADPQGTDFRYHLAQSPPYSGLPKSTKGFPSPPPTWNLYFLLILNRKIWRATHNSASFGRQNKVPATSAVTGTPVWSGKSPRLLPAPSPLDSHQPKAPPAPGGQPSPG